MRDNLASVLSKKQYGYREADNEGIRRSDDEDDGVEEEILDGGFTSFSFMKVSFFFF